MKRAAALGSLWLAVGLAACGPSRIVLTVDVLSFLRADSLDAFSFGVRGGVPRPDFPTSSSSTPLQRLQERDDGFLIALGQLTKTVGHAARFAPMPYDGVA